MTIIQYTNDEDAFALSLFRFGIIKARSDEIKTFLNGLRKTEGRVYFLSAPRWFNCIWNIGGVK